MCMDKRLHIHRHDFLQGFTVESHSLLSLLKRSHLNKRKLLLPTADPNILDTSPLLVLLEARLLHRLLEKGRKHFSIDWPIGWEIADMDTPSLEKRGLGFRV